MGELRRLDIPEERAKCNICGYDLSYPEFMALNGRCIFHAEEGLTVLKCMSFFAYILLLWRDYRVMKGKLRMKARGLTEVDFQAVISEIAPELHNIDSEGLGKLIGHMKRHKGFYVAE